MDEKSMQTAKRQYERVFSSPQAFSTMNTPQRGEDTFLSTLNFASLYIMDARLGDEDFDAITMAPDEIEGCMPEDLLTMINLKLKRLIEVLGTEELIYKTSEVENDQLKEVLDEKMKQTEGVVVQLKNEIESLLEKNENLILKKRNNISGVQRLDDELQRKDDNILQLNKNIKQMMDEYLIKREQAEARETRINSLKSHASKLKNELQAAAAQTIERQQIIDEKERELQDMKREYNNNLKSIKQSEKHLAEFGGVFDKKVEENDRHQQEYTKLLEKHANNVKAIQEIERLIAETKDEIETKNKELSYVRSLNKMYEDKANRLQEIERAAHHEELTLNRLRDEKEIFLQQIKDLAPHSIVDDSPNEQLLKELQSNAKLEKYSDMKPDDILTELDKYRRVAAHKNQEVANLEAKNTRLIAEVNKNKYTLTDLRTEAAERLGELDRLREEQLEIENKERLLSKDVEKLLAGFTKISIILDKKPEEVDPNYKFSFNEDKKGDEGYEDHTPVKNPKPKPTGSSGRNQGSKKK